MADRMRLEGRSEYPKVGERVSFVYVAANTHSKASGIKQLDSYDAKTGETKRGKTIKLESTAGDKIDVPSYVLRNKVPIDYQSYITRQFMTPLLGLFELIDMEGIQRVIAEAMVQAKRGKKRYRANELARYFTDPVVCLHCKTELSGVQPVPIHRDHRQRQKRFDAYLHFRLEQARANGLSDMFVERVRETVTSEYEDQQLDRVLFPEFYPRASAMCDSPECRAKTMEYYMHTSQTLAEAETIHHKCWTACQRCTTSHFNADKCVTGDCPISSKRKSNAEVIQQARYTLERFDW
jgi:hypothetical protein